MSVEQSIMEQAIERMAEAGARDSLPSHGLFNSDQLEAMLSERMASYRRVAAVMLKALLKKEG